MKRQLHVGLAMDMDYGCMIVQLGGEHEVVEEDSKAVVLAGEAVVLWQCSHEGARNLHFSPSSMSHPRPVCRVEFGKEFGGHFELGSVSVPK